MVLDSVYVSPVVVVFVEWIWRLMKILRRLQSSFTQHDDDAHVGEGNSRISMSQVYQWQTTCFALCWLSPPSLIRRRQRLRVNSKWKIYVNFHFLVLSGANEWIVTVLRWLRLDENTPTIIKSWFESDSSKAACWCSVEPDNSMCSYVSSLSGRTWMSRTGSDPLCLILLATKKRKDEESHITWVFMFIIADKTLQERIVNSSFNISLSFFFFVLFIASTKRVCELTSFSSSSVP